MAALAGGSLTFLGVLILFLIGVVIALYTRRGSGMEHHPYQHVYAGAPGATTPCDDYSGSDRTLSAEREVSRAWRQRRDAEDPAVVEARIAEARERRRAASARKGRSDRMPVSAPVRPLR